MTSSVIIIKIHLIYEQKQCLELTLQFQMHFIEQINFNPLKKLVRF